MPCSVFEIFKIGVGPSSSHTMGPMTAAAQFADRLASSGMIGRVSRVEVRLYGSLALTGKGHATDSAILLGLSGFTPALLDPDEGDRTIMALRGGAPLRLAGQHDISFSEDDDLLFLQRERLPHHSNAMLFRAFDTDGELLDERTIYSVGGGAIIDDAELGTNAAPTPPPSLPHDYHSGAEMLAMAHEAGLSLAQLAWINEQAASPDLDIGDGLARIADAMSACIDRGLA